MQEGLKLLEQIQVPARRGRPGYRSGWPRPWKPIRGAREPASRILWRKRDIIEDF
ncbi:MAG: hypothetical protein MZV70_43950 [Desulfobacterales bacterium]|nr:hypothetical protein [Desulfobacterales bacterium]